MQIPLTQLVADVIALRRQLLTKARELEPALNEQFDITIPQLDAILQVDADSNVTMGQLAERLVLADSTLTALIDGMERKGLVERVNSTTDRRAITLRLTCKAHDIISTIKGA